MRIIRGTMTIEPAWKKKLGVSYMHARTWEQ